eukprot:274462_1
MTATNAFTESLQQFQTYVGIRNECKLLHIPIIATDTSIINRKERLKHVAGQVSLTYVFNLKQNEKSMIEHVADHYITINNRALQFVHNLNDKDEENKNYGTEEGLTPHLRASDVSHSEDVVNIDPNKLMRMIQECSIIDTKCGHKYNLRSLETRLCEEYIIGRKFIQQLDDIIFEFAGEFDIAAITEKINYRYKAQFFNNPPNELLENIKRKIDAKNASEYNISKANKLDLYKNAMLAVEKSINALEQEKTLTEQTQKIKLSKFMKETLPTYMYEFEAFEFSNLELQHLEKIWRYLDRLYALYQGIWQQIPECVMELYRRQITKNIECQLEQFMERFDLHTIWKFVRSFRVFLERICCTDIKQADTLSLYLYLSNVADIQTDFIQYFPQNIKLNQAAKTYKYCIQKYQQRSNGCNNPNELYITSEFCKCFDRTFSVLKQHDSGIGMQKLIEVCQTKYQSLLDDFIHIISEHNNDFSFIAINKGLCCDISSCSIAHRYYFKGSNSETKIEEDGVITFYRNLLDSIHCYFYHLQDFGLRIDTERGYAEPVEMVVEVTEGLEHRWIDNEFRYMKSHIKERMGKLHQLELANGTKMTRGEINKFNVETNSYDINNNSGNNTMINGLYKFMQLNNIDQQTINATYNLFVKEEYDSDAIIEDISDRTNSNIALYCCLAVEAIQRCIYVNKVYQHTFSVGYRFHYMHWIHLSSDLKLTEKMLVKAKHLSFKEEILHNSAVRLSMAQWLISLNKSTRYSTTSKVKTMKCVFDFCGYGFNIGDKITKQHLLSIILYCDWDELQKEFSSTFRRTDTYEPLSSVIQRNSEYAIWSRLVRETVEIFGIDVDYSYDNTHGITVFPGRGPFFCGMSHVMVVLEFDISLCAPTSTSKEEAVALTFAGDHGILIQLNNNGENDNIQLKSFCCSWLSDYQGENEWLFCGGQYKIKIESIKTIENNENYTSFFKGLFYFDCMINGSKLEGFNVNKIEVAKIDYLMLTKLIKHKLKTNGFSNNYPKYINQTFEAFTNNKNTITLNLHQICKHLAALSGLIFHSVQTNQIEQPPENCMAVCFVTKLLIEIVVESIDQIKNSDKISNVTKRILTKNKARIIEYFQFYSPSLSTGIYGTYPYYSHIQNSIAATMDQRLFVDAIIRYCANIKLNEILCILHKLVTVHPKYSMLHVDLNNERISGKTNIFLPKILKLFPNIDDIVVHSTIMDIDSSEYYEYRINLISLLDVILTSPQLFTLNHLKITIKAENKYKREPSKKLLWIRNSWIYSKDLHWDLVQSQFNKHKLTIERSTTYIDKLRIKIKQDVLIIRTMK